MPARNRLEAALDTCAPAVVACSGGIDSLVLATVAHRRDPGRTVVAHTVTPAVPGDGTARVLAFARSEGWRLEVVRSREFDDEQYLSNPTDRCYHCKTNLYDAISELEAVATAVDATIVSGANLDDLGDYRPGLIAASEHDVRHPYVESGIDKAGIRSLATELGLAISDLPASPCLASRLYTGTRVTEARLRAVGAGEAVLRAAGLAVSRCRIRGHDVLVEVPTEDRSLVTDGVLHDVSRAMGAHEPRLRAVALDDRAYRPGQAVLHQSADARS